ncbi:MAG: aminotransferase class I/II-fold pyridoxal phosphate-dependent enzyme [Cyanobacteria bacterium]|nr:aminotransferase class I/II-fold pyridoxal phosphate-dependent enzyme [Cyanobacteriota bacterium]
MSWEASQFSLADFYYSDSDSPLTPPADYVAWRRDTAWATSLYEPVLCDPAGPINRLRTATGEQRVINMTSYGYLGLVRHPKVIAAAKQALDDYGTGACGSPILSGKSTLYQALEIKLSALTGYPAVLLFNSGFGGALGCAAGLMRKGDVAVVDARAHISMVDGLKVGGAKIAFFEHNSARALDEVLSAHNGARRLIFVDGLYSMDGDLADLPALIAVAESHGVGILVDEAHSFLCCGNTGGGVVEHFGMRAKVGVQYGTLSKAFSCGGGFAAASTDLIDYLRFYANTYGFTCAMPPSVVAAASAVIDVMQTETWRRAQLWENAAYFRTQLQSLGINTGESTSYVVPIVVGENRALLYQLGHQLREHGLFVTPVDYPTVALDQARFRASVTALHTRALLDQALQIIEDVFVPAMREKGLLRARAM